MRYQFYRIKVKPKRVHKPGDPEPVWEKVTDAQVVEAFGGPSSGLDPQRWAATILRTTGTNRTTRNGYMWKVEPEEDKPAAAVKAEDMKPVFKINLPAAKKNGERMFWRAANEKIDAFATRVLRAYIEENSTVIDVGCCICEHKIDEVIRQFAPLQITVVLPASSMPGLRGASKFHEASTREVLTERLFGRWGDSEVPITFISGSEFKPTEIRVTELMPKALQAFYIGKLNEAQVEFGRALEEANEPSPPVKEAAAKPAPLRVGQTVYWPVPSGVPGVDGEEPRKFAMSARVISSDNETVTLRAFGGIWFIKREHVYETETEALKADFRPMEWN